MIPRIVARLDVKRDKVVKGVSMQGERVVGDPHTIAVQRYADGADELLYVDTYASLVGRNALHPIIERAADDVFVPLCVAGGIRSKEDVREALLSGADRVGVNTQAVRSRGFCETLRDTFGSSTIALIIDASRDRFGWQALTEYGREPSGLDAVAWARACAGIVGEVIVTSVDHDGRMCGPDVALVEALAGLPCPLTYGGGVRDANDVARVLDAGADAVSIGTALHFGHTTISRMKQELVHLGRRVRV